MFTPSRDEVRRFFIDTWAKYRAGTPLEGLESVALQVILAHSEYRSVLENPPEAERDYSVEAGATNPFLHMSLHLAIEEQLSIDQPSGLRAEYQRIAAKSGDPHEAQHALLECLGETVWRAQRERAAPDAETYLECVRKK